MRVNDFSIHVATVNGSGSQSSNNLLLRAVFRMGVPVSGKNLFPSNIQGLPTWFTIRLSEEGWSARSTRYAILVCMNEGTYIQDVQDAPSGCVVIHHEEFRVSSLRNDVISIPVPFKTIIKEACDEAPLRKLTINMVYVGVLAELLGIEDEAIIEAMQKQFRGKEKVFTLNYKALQAGRDYIKENPPGDFPFKIEKRDKTKDKILVEGNEAAAIGALFAGCQFVSWYPITPSSSLIEHFQKYSNQYRYNTTTGEKQVAVVQAEDEMAALGMVLGASWMGARAMTSSSGPGISLMSEFSGYSYFAELPAVIFDIQRIGPSTGLPTRTSQGDLSFVASLGHGDSKHIILLPATVEECYQFALEAFDLADQLQTAVFVLSDLDLGMNTWMSAPFSYRDQNWKRGKILTDDDRAALEDFGRYRDKDGDGIPYRTLPGSQDRRGVFFTRGSGHNEDANYTESSEAYTRLMQRLERKWNTARKLVPSAVIESEADDQSAGMIAFGSSHPAALECIDDLHQKFGIKMGYLRIRAYPFSDEVREFLERYERVYVVEQNRDRQMKSLLSSEPGYEAYASKLISLCYFNGLPIPASFISDEILKYEGKDVTGASHVSA